MSKFHIKISSIFFSIKKKTKKKSSFVEEQYWRMCFMMVFPPLLWQQLFMAQNSLYHDWFPEQIQYWAIFSYWQQTKRRFLSLRGCDKKSINRLQTNTTTVTAAAISTTPLLLVQPYYHHHSCHHPLPLLSPRPTVAPKSLPPSHISTTRYQ